jgi:hypothetical protein
MRGYVLLSFIAVFTMSRFATYSNTQDFYDPPAKRQATIIQSYTEHEWWLLAWADNSLACKIALDAEGIPGLSEVQSVCSSEVYMLWLEQPACSAAASGQEASSCKGYYLFYAGSHQAQRETVVELPPASASVNLRGCSQSNYEITCPLLPSLLIQSVEPLPEYFITQVNYQIDAPPNFEDGSGACEGAICEVQLSLTSTVGVRMTFWADSSFGDSSEKHEVLFRVKPTGDGQWEVQILGDEGLGIRDESSEQDRVSVYRNQAMSVQWQAFPPLGGNPSWLAYPSDASGLTSSEPFQYLAGQLILAGTVDISACSDGGVLGNGYASQCGLEQAMGKVIEWQNRFDARIFEIASRHDLSPQLLKNIIARESQFWPGLYAPSPLEYGIARLTETGTDTLFRWNDGFYAEFCSQILWDEMCVSGYDNLAKVYQEMLRGALATRVNVYCEPCQYGFDLGRVDFGIEMLAQSLLANAAQVEQIFVNLTGEKAGASSSYEDLWRFTLVNYNAGPGCLAAALKATVKGHAELNWVNVSANLVGGCQDAIGYVENIAK